MNSNSSRTRARYGLLAAALLSLLSSACIQVDPSGAAAVADAKADANDEMVVADVDSVSASGEDPIQDAEAKLLALPSLGSLRGSLPPSRNFDLRHWKLTLPSGDEVQSLVLNSGYAYGDWFYTDLRTGGMVFRSPNLAGHTANSRYSRSELREMRLPDGPASAAGNNWTLADGGRMTATLRVDRVSTTGDAKKAGRVVIGQIHGTDHEPIRLYFHQAPGESKGRLYARMDSADGWSERQSPDIVTNRDGQGIALGETFRYAIRLVGRRLTVNVRLASGASAAYSTLIDAGYASDRLYFKAGVYNQNNTGDPADDVQATFFALGVTH